VVRTFGEEKNILPLLGIKLQFPISPACNLVTVLSTLSQLQYLVYSLCNIREIFYVFTVCDNKYNVMGRHGSSCGEMSCE
jgi:hypothetical protein